MGDDRISSSSEEDGDADWRAAIDSVAATTTFGKTTDKVHSSATAANGESVDHPSQEDEIDTTQPRKLKHYQLKVAPYFLILTCFLYSLQLLLTEPASAPMIALILQSLFISVLIAGL